MGVKERKARQFQAREEEIVHSALNLFYSNHPASITMEMIARETEIGRGTLYLHFKSKDDIYARIIISRNQRLFERFKEVNLQQPPLELLKQLVSTYVEFCLADADGYRVQKQCDQLLIKENLKPEILAELVELRGNRIELLREAIEKGIKAGLLPKVDATLQLSAAWGMLYGAIDIILEGHFKDEIADKRHYLDFIQDKFIHSFIGKQ